MQECAAPGGQLGEDRQAGWQTYVQTPPTMDTPELCGGKVFLSDTTGHSVGAAQWSRDYAGIQSCLQLSQPPSETVAAMAPEALNHQCQNQVPVQEPRLTTGTGMP